MQKKITSMQIHLENTVTILVFPHLSFLFMLLRGSKPTNRVADQLYFVKQNVHEFSFTS
jgi:hypothetical protein